MLIMTLTLSAASQLVTVHWLHEPDAHALPRTWAARGCTNLMIKVIRQLQAAAHSARRPRVKHACEVLRVMQAASSFDHIATTCLPQPAAGTRANTLTST